MVCYSMAWYDVGWWCMGRCVCVCVWVCIGKFLTSFPRLLKLFKHDILKEAQQKQV